MAFWDSGESGEADVRADGAVSVGFKVYADRVFLRGVVQVFDTGRDACHWYAALNVSWDCRSLVPSTCGVDRN